MKNIYGNYKTIKSKQKLKIIHKCRNNIKLNTLNYISYNSILKIIFTLDCKIFSILNIFLIIYL